jgi:hypothetical protein
MMTADKIFAFVHGVELGLLILILWNVWVSK